MSVDRQVSHCVTVLLCHCVTVLLDSTPLHRIVVITVLFIMSLCHCVTDVLFAAVS